MQTSKTVTCLHMLYTHDPQKSPMFHHMATSLIRDTEIPYLDANRRHGRVQVEFRYALGCYRVGVGTKKVYASEGKG